MIHRLRRNISALSSRTLSNLLSFSTLHISSSRTFYLSPLFPSRTFCSSPSYVAHSPAATDYRSLLQANDSNELADSTVHHHLDKSEEFGSSDEYDVDDGLSPFDELKLAQSKVGIFWDLDNKPPKSASPYEAAVKLRKTVSSFGIVRYMVAYANRHTFSYVPHAVKELRNEREVLNHLENKGIIKSIEPYMCRVCGRKFKTNEKLMKHFTIHEREHQKRLNQIKAVKGKKRDELVGRYAVKMEKYRNASRDVLIPKVGYGLADELKRAGFWVKTVSDKPQAADVGLRNRMVDLMDRGKVQCLVLVSDDSDFLGVLEEARERCVKTLVVGDNINGVLMRNADGCFSWRDVIAGKAETEAVSVLGRWRDHDSSERLKLTYDREVEKDAHKLKDSRDFEDHYDEDGESGNSTANDDKPWWKLD